MPESSGNTPRRLDLTHVPEPGWTTCAATLIRAGRVAAGPGDAVARESYPGQDILYCVSGQGTIESEGQRQQVSRGDIAWIANERPHRHEADRSDPWTVLWCRLDGPALPRLRLAVLSGMGGVVNIQDASAMLSWFERAFSTLGQPVLGRGLDVQLNVLAAELLGLIARDAQGGVSQRMPRALADLLRAMRAKPEAAWTSEDMVNISKLSAAQTRRLFRRHLDLTPRAWLRRERLALAQRLIAELDLPLAQVAARCGFCDVYHFSRAFKAEIGLAPSSWRDGGATRPARPRAFREDLH